MRSSFIPSVHQLYPSLSSRMNHHYNSFYHHRLPFIISTSFIPNDYGLVVQLIPKLKQLFHPYYQPEIVILVNLLKIVMYTSIKVY